mgnify:CR=1 FL=1
MSNPSNAEKMTNRMFRRSLIPKIIIGVIVLFIAACVAIYLYDDSRISSFRGKFDLGEGMEETLREMGPSTKTISPFAVDYMDGANKALIRIRSSYRILYIDYALAQKEAGHPEYSLYEYPDIDAYLYWSEAGYFTRKETIRYHLFGKEVRQCFCRRYFGVDKEDALKPPKYRYYYFIELKKESEDNCYWIYAEMNHPEFANDVMKEAVRQINAYVEPDEQT